MSRAPVAVLFSNGMGNFIFFSAAIKILKKWGYEHIDLITDDYFYNYKPLREITEGIFDNILTELDKDKYERIFMANWSVPLNYAKKRDEIVKRSRTINWHTEGVHEVQEYLRMIGASWQDFDGYLLEPDDEPLLNLPRPIIALSNCASTNQAHKKRWKYFPELSKILQDQGYSVVLVGLGDELKGCVGKDFVDKLTIRQTAKVLEQCDALVSVSTGNSIVADAVRTPVLLLEGPMLTSRAHPLQSRFDVVRRYVSCAPCFQKMIWKVCDNPICMDEITPDEVFRRLMNFLKHSKKPKRFWQIPSTHRLKGKKLKTDKSVAFLIPCRDRYYALRDFLGYLERSHLPKSEIFFLNDASIDPRVEELLLDFQKKHTSKDCIVHYYHRDFEEVDELYRKYKVNETVHASNYLIQRMYDSDCDCDYVLRCDSDLILKPYWVQKMILAFEEAKKEHPEIITCSGFNSIHPIYDDETTLEVYSTSVSDYRISRGCNAAYLITMEDMKNIHGFFEVGTMITSSDIKKNSELVEKGYKAMLLVPSVIEHFGAFDSSAPFAKTTLVSEDFCE